MENAKQKPKPKRKRKEFQDSGHIVNTEKQMTQDELRGVENRFKFPEQVLSKTI